jgi:N-glycosylase/DNA lyase
MTAAASLRRPGGETVHQDTQRGVLRHINVDLASRTPSARNATGISDHWYWSGLPWQLGSAAYWEALASEAETPTSYRLGASLDEEVGACMLGGFGIPAEIANAAFRRLRDEGVFKQGECSSPERIESLLGSPLPGPGRPRKYRFARQKAGRLSAALEQLRAVVPPQESLTLRNWLMTLPGIGPKTASWIVRNHTGSDEVGIIDIHIIRAGQAAGVFNPSWQVTRDYFVFERAFLQWAMHGGVAASLLDACIWGVLSGDSSDARDILGTQHLSSQPQAVWPVDARSFGHQQLR